MGKEKHKFQRPKAILFVVKEKAMEIGQYMNKGLVQMFACIWYYVRA